MSAELAKPRKQRKPSKVGQAGLPPKLQRAGARTMRIEAIDRHVGMRVRLARTERGMTMMDLAAAVGVSQAQIEKYERAENACAPARIWALSRALHVEPGWFFEDFAPAAAVSFGKIIVPDVPAEVMEIAEGILALPPAQRRVAKEVVRQFLAGSVEGYPRPAGKT